MKLRFLLAGIVATGLFASAPDAVAHGGFGGGHGGGGFHGGGGGFHGGGGFRGGGPVRKLSRRRSVRRLSRGALGGFAGGVSASFTAMDVFSVPVSMDTRGGGVGVIPIIGVTRITHITRHTTVTMGMGTRRSPE